MRLNFQKKTLNDKSEEEIFNEVISERNIKLNQLKSNGKYIVIRGFYDEILEYILSKFSRDNLYIGISEEINQNKLKYYNEIYEFLGTTKLIKINDTLNTHVRKYTKKIPKKLEKYLYNIYKPHNEKLYKILGRKIDSWENYYIQLKSAF
jgi:site-specific recombinase XerD